MPKSDPPIFPIRDAWLPALPVLPLLISAALLSWLIDPTKELGFLTIEPAHFLGSPERDYIHLGDMLTYCALATCHTLLCLAVIASFSHWILGLPKRRLSNAAIFLAAATVLIVTIGAYFVVDANHQVIVQVGYKVVCRIIAAADLPTQLVAPNQCFGDDTSLLTWLAWIPTFAGMGAVVFAAAYAHSTARDLPCLDDRYEKTDSRWRASIESRVKELQRSVYLLSTVLVSSTVTITFFAHLPAGLLRNEKDLMLSTALSKYATGLSTFWGALFSVTLIATFAAPALRLVGEAYGAKNATQENANLRHWLHEHVFQSIKRQLFTALSLLAPLLVGPLSSLFSSLSGS